jgi:hypothetical protein
MTESTKVSDPGLAQARLQALEEAGEEARRFAREWRDDADGTHSSHQSGLLRTWADAADRVAEAIAALARTRS